jgi:hypothetical protein
MPASCSPLVLADHGPGEVAKQLGISRQTVYKWVRRFRAEGAAGLTDRSSRPHRMPRRTSVEPIHATCDMPAEGRGHGRCDDDPGGAVGHHPLAGR